MENINILKEVLVQILGFVIVFFILKAFAWEKLLGAIDARRKKIADDFLGIEKQKAGLEKLERDYRQKLDQIELEARAKIQEAAAMGLSLLLERLGWWPDESELVRLLTPIASLVWLTECAEVGEILVEVAEHITHVREAVDAIVDRLFTKKAASVPA